MTHALVIQPIILSALAVTMFQTAILFISGDLARNNLSGFYAIFPHGWQRMMLMLPLLLGPGNLIASKAIQQPGIALPAIMFFQVWAAGLAYSYVTKNWLSPNDLALLAVISVLVLWLGLRFHGGGV